MALPQNWWTNSKDWSDQKPLVDYINKEYGAGYVGSSMYYGVIMGKHYATSSNTYFRGKATYITEQQFLDAMKKECKIIKSKEQMIQKISRENLRQIYNIACSSWREKIKEYTKRNSFENEIVLTDEEVTEMYVAANTEQKKVLDKYLKLPVVDNNLIKEVDHYIPQQINKLLFGGEEVFQRLNIGEYAGRALFFNEKKYDVQISGVVGGGSFIKFTRK